MALLQAAARLRSSSRYFGNRHGTLGWVLKDQDESSLVGEIFTFVDFDANSREMRLAYCDHTRAMKACEHSEGEEIRASANLEAENTQTFRASHVASCDRAL
jgi:hypothetical protein